ncbi:MAG: WD40/YVTN/BNR-like repeat-containing protein, partial [Candidatus Acidiferrales bacterium]
MKRVWRGKRGVAVAVCAVAGLLCISGVVVAQERQQRAAAPAGPDYEAAMKNLRFRSIGPAIMGGRVDDFAVVESNPSIVYAGMASGGVWKTINGGTTWQPLFDEQAVSTIGDVTVAPSDPSIVWVGTGEPNNRQSSSWGNGVYKSNDAGKTWQHMGLAATQSIARIVIHPRDPNTVFVAAAGGLWGPNRERGVYKTTDGGRSWTNVLFINEDTGVVDIAMDHASPGTLLAAAYQRRRTVFGFSGSGPHGGIYKTIDGGANWEKIEKGLPWDPDFRDLPPQRQQAGGGGGAQAARQAQQAAPAQEREEEKGPQEIGRIGLNFYRKDTNIVYALVEHGDGGTFRSEDKGETWTKMSNTNPRPMYYSKIHIDPNNDQRLWVLGAQMFNSDDGGRTFRNNLVQRIHGDYHALWINPAN